MATESFGDKADRKPKTAAQAAPANSGDTQPKTAVATTADSTLALPIESGFTGSWDRNDVRLPRLNLVHKTSAVEMIEKFGIGGFAFNKEVKLGDGKKPIIITALRAAKDYIQKLPYGSPDAPQVFNTPKEVEDNGGSLNFKDVNSGRYFQPRAHIQVITALPEGASEEDSALFAYEFNGVSYGMAMFTVASSAYTSVGKELATLYANNKVMRKGLLYGILELTSEVKTSNSNSWHVPVIKYAGEVPADLAKFYASLLA